MHQLDFAKRRETFQLLRPSVSVAGAVGGQALATGAGQARLKRSGPGAHELYAATDA